MVTIEFIATVVVAFALFAIPGFPLPPTLLVPVAAAGITPLPLENAWAAWAIALLASAFLPMVRSGFRRITTYLLERQGLKQQPPQGRGRYTDGKKRAQTS